MSSAQNLQTSQELGTSSIYNFIFDILLIFHLVSCAIFLIINSIFWLVCLALAVATLYIKISFGTSKKNFITLWFHANILSVGVAGSLVLGFESGIYIAIVALICTNYFCAFKSSFVAYLILSIEIIAIIMLKISDPVMNDTPEWLLHLCVTIYSLMAFFIVMRLCLFANSIKSTSQIAIADEKSELEHISYHDNLTGLLNRRSIEQLYKKRDKIFRSPNSVVVLGDIDNFKQINDTFGHIWGDKILKDVASALRQTFRKDDIICRWGGEEFLIIIENTNINSIYALSERLIANINAIKLPNDAPATMTFGMAIFPSGMNDKFHQAVEQADQLLYKGKKSGKDRVEMEIIKQ